jgi:signal transduction histidine kinase
MTDDIVARLERHRTIGVAPRAELEWLAAHGTLHVARLGESLVHDSDVINKLVVVLSGQIAIHVDRGLGPHKVMEWRAGDVAGYLPYSRMAQSPGDPVVVEAGEFFIMPRDHFPEMIRECPTITTALVHLMLDRVRRFTSSDLQDEKMMSLGRLSAGLAHELNNPASAAARSARMLADGLTELEETSRALGAARLGAAQLEAIERWCHACHAGAPPTASPMERADREEALAEWLDAHGADADAAAALVDTAVTIADLDALAAAVDANVLGTAVRWLAADCTTRTLAVEVERSVSRIHDLVAAVKRFTYMDRTSAPEAVDLSISVGDSVALLMHKARKKSVTIAVDLPPDLPRVRAIGGDLNQIWTNLLDNALDAVPPSGHVTIAAARQVDFVIVRFADDGPGIPEEIRERIFDPFFTTKPVGQGTGLGLDITRRLVRRNDGDIEVESRPGRTEFRVALPIAADASGAASR